MRNRKQFDTVDKESNRKNRIIRKEGRRWREKRIKVIQEREYVDRKAVVRNRYDRPLKLSCTKIIDIQEFANIAFKQIYTTRNFTEDGKEIHNLAHRLSESRLPYEEQK